MPSLGATDEEIVSDLTDQIGHLREDLDNALAEVERLRAAIAEHEADTMRAFGRIAAHDAHLYFVADGKMRGL